MRLVHLFLLASCAGVVACSRGSKLPSARCRAPGLAESAAPPGQWPEAPARARAARRLARAGVRTEVKLLTLSDTPQPPSCSYSNTGNITEQRARTSGELRSKHNWFRYGRYEVSLRAPSVKPNEALTSGNYITSLFTYRQPACQAVARDRSGGDRFYRCNQDTDYPCADMSTACLAATDLDLTANNAAAYR